MLDALKQMAHMGVPIVGILHVGANEGQERNDYAASGASPCLYVEPVEAAYAILKDNLAGMPFHTPIQAVCAERAGEEVLFNVASNGGQSSSLLALGAHAEHHPDIVYTGAQAMVTTTVDAIVAAHSPRRVPNLLVIDAQGADLRVLKGATKTLREVFGVFVEASQAPLYDGGCTYREITAFLADFDLHPRWLSLDRWGHGEAFFCRKPSTAQPPIDLIPLMRHEGNRALNRPAAQSSLCEWSYFHTAKGPGGAVNGAFTGQFGFHTAVEGAPWWQVDLEAVHALNEVRVYNRMDSGLERSRTLQILLSRDGETWELVHDQGGYTFGGATTLPLRVMLASIPARFVRLQLAEHTALHLDQVQIF